MGSWGKVVLALAFGFVFWVAVFSAAAWAIFVRPGVLHVDIADRHSSGHISVDVPFALFRSAMCLAELDHHDDDFDDWAPAVRAAMTELDKYPNADLLSVDGEGGHFELLKRNGEYQLEIRGDDGHVQVQVPAVTARAAIDLACDR